MEAILAVKRNRSASRVLAVLETIAQHQPVGVSELARLMEADKSAVQRAIMTLADDGWIHTAPGTHGRWELTAHILTVAHAGQRGNDLRLRARSALEALRSESGETVILTVPDIRDFVVIDVLESPQFLRTAPHVGLVVPARGSATSRAILPYLTEERRQEVFGGPLDETTRSHLAATLEKGYAVSEGDVMSGSTNIAAPIFEIDGRVLGAIVISGPSERLDRDQHERFGAMVLRAARDVSRGAPVLPRTAS